MVCIQVFSSPASDRWLNNKTYCFSHHSHKNASLLWGRECCFLQRKPRIHTVPSLSYRCSCWFLEQTSTANVYEFNLFTGWRDLKANSSALNHIHMQLCARWSRCHNLFLRLTSLFCPIRQRGLYSHASMLTVVNCKQLRNVSFITVFWIIVLYCLLISLHRVIRPITYQWHCCASNLS